MTREYQIVIVHVGVAGRFCIDRNVDRVGNEGHWSKPGKPLERLSAGRRKANVGFLKEIAELCGRRWVADIVDGDRGDFDSWGDVADASCGLRRYHVALLQDQKRGFELACDFDETFVCKPLAERCRMPNA